MADSPSYRLHLLALVCQAAYGLAAWGLLTEGKVYLSGIYLATAAGVHLSSFWWFFTQGKQTPGWALWHAGAPILGLSLLPLAVGAAELAVALTGEPRPELAAYALGVLGARGIVERAKEKLLR